MPPMVPRFMPLQTAGGRRIGGWDRDATPFRTFLAKQTGRRPPVPPPSPATVLPLLMAMQAAGGNQQPVFRPPPPPPGQPPRTTLPSGTPVLALPNPGVGTMAAQPRYPAPPPPSPATLLPFLAAMQAAGANQQGVLAPGATTRPAPVVVPPVAAPVAPPTADDVAAVLSFVRGSQGQAPPVPEPPLLDMSPEEAAAAETAGTALTGVQAAQSAYDEAKAQLEANPKDQTAKDAFKQAADALVAAQAAYKAANEAQQAVAPEGESVLGELGDLPRETVEAAGEVAGTVGEMVKADLKAVQEGANWLLEHVGQPVTGYAIYQTVLHGDEVLGAIPLPPEAKRHILDLLHDTLPEGEEGITRAYEEGYERPVGYSPGYDPTSVALGASPVETARIPPGGKAVEAYVRDELCASPSTFAALSCNYLLDFFEDPLTYAFGAGQVVKGVTAGTRAARAGQVIGGVLQAPDVAVERVVKPVVRGIGDVAQRIRGVRAAIDKAPTTYVRQRGDELFGAGQEELSAGTVDIGGTTPATGGVPGTTTGGAPSGGAPTTPTTPTAPTTPAAPTTTPGVPGRRGTYLDPKEREAAQATALGQQPRAVTAVDALPPEANAVYDDLIAPANEAHAARQNALTNKDNLDFDPTLTRQERDLLVTLNQADYMVYDFYPTFRRAAGSGVPMPPYRYNSGKYAKVPGENATIDMSSDGNVLEHAVFGRTSPDRMLAAFTARQPKEAARVARLRRDYVVVRDATDLANLPPPRFAVSVGPLPQAPPSGVAAAVPPADVPTPPTATETGGVTFRVPTQRKYGVRDESGQVRMFDTEAEARAFSGERVVPPATAEAAPPVVTVAKQRTGAMGTIPAHYKVAVNGVVDDRFRVRKKGERWVTEELDRQTGIGREITPPGTWRATTKATPEAVQRRLAAEGGIAVPGRPPVPPVSAAGPPISPRTAPPPPAPALSLAGDFIPEGWVVQPDPAGGFMVRDPAGDAVARGVPSAAEGRRLAWEEQGEIDIGFYESGAYLETPSTEDLLEQISRDVRRDLGRRKSVSPEPPLPQTPGMVRLYRAEPVAQARRGRWFTDDIDLAKLYQEQMGTTDYGAAGVRLLSLEVPVDQLDAFRTVNSPVAHRFSAIPEHDFFLPRELAEQATEVLPPGDFIPGGGVPGQVPPTAVTAPRPLPPPPVERNFITRLSDYTDTLYRETGIDDAEIYLPTTNIGQTEFPNDVYFANTPDLALSQGGKGVHLEFDAGDVEGIVNQKMPSWQFAWEQGQAEFFSRYVTPKELQANLRAVTLDAGATGRRPNISRVRSALKELEALGWSRTDNADGSVTWRRPEPAGVIAEGPPPATEPVPAPATPSTAIEYPPGSLSWVPESPVVARPSLDVAPTELPTPSGTVPPAATVPPRTAPPTPPPGAPPTTPTPPVGVDGPLPAGATPETLAVPISEPSRRILETPFREGPYAGATQRQVWDTLTDEARRYTQNAPDARKIRAAWGKDAPLLDEAATPREAAFHRLMALAEADEAVFRKVDPNARPGLWTLFHRSTASFLLQSPTRVIPYVLRNIGGNEFLVMMAHGRPVETGFLRAAVRVEEAGEAGVIQKVLAAVARKAGVTADSPALADVVASGMGSKTPRQLGSGDKFDIGFDPIVQFIDRLHGGKLRVLGKPNARGAAWANEVEKVEREGLWRQRLREYLATGEVDFVERLAASRGARAAGFDVDRIRAALAPLDVVHAPRGVGQALADAGAGRELVQQAMQDWANVARKSWDNAIADVNRPMPLYNERNIDRWLKTAIPFHFWQSRASAFVMESMLRNPAYLANFLRIQESYRELADDPNLPPWMRGMMRIGGTILGVNWYSNPLTVLLPAIFLRGETPDDVNLTWVGRRRRELREYGVGLWPSLDTTLNVLGVFGPESIQGVLPIAELAVVGKMIDLGLAELDEGMGVPIQQNFYRWLREEVTGFLEGQGVPGVSEIRATDPNAYKMDLVASQIQADHPELVATWLAGENPDATPEEKAAGQAALAELSAMLSPGSPEWNAAWRQVALVGAVDVAVGTVSPLPLIPRQPLRDQTLALTREGRENLEAGAPLTPEQQAAFEQRGMATTPVESPLPGGQPYPLQQFEREVGEYYGLGTDEQKAALAAWSTIAFGDAPPAVTVGEQTLTSAQILAMPTDARAQLADLDAMTRGTFDDIEALRREREAFVAAHPTFRAYQDWAKQERDKLGDEPGQFADEQAYRDAAGPNPNLSAYYDGIEQRHADDPAGYTAEELERDTFGPDAYLNTLGIKTNIYDPAPLDVRSPEDIPYTPGQERQGTGPATQGTDPAQRIRDDIADYQQKSLVMDLIVSSLSEGRVTRWADLDPMWQVHLSQFYGDLAPRLSAETQAYVLWTQRQPPGTDTSPEAFLASKDALTQAYVQMALSGQPLSPEMLAQLRGQPGLGSYDLPGVRRALGGFRGEYGVPTPAPFTAFRAGGVPLPSPSGFGGTGVPLPNPYGGAGLGVPLPRGARGGVPMPRG